MKNIEVGQVVKSKAGRDKDKIFIVLDIVDERYVYIVDGNIRKLDKPKLKKIKHLSLYNKVFKEVPYKINNNIKLSNEYIRKLLEPII